MERVVKNASKRITVPFGNGHLGVDLGWTGEDQIYAHTSGKVTTAVTGKKKDNNTSGMATYGNYIDIKHNGGYLTRYAHLSAVDVKVGDVVEEGQKIGDMGESGNTYGKHLHFEVRNSKGNVVNPTSYLTENLPGEDIDTQEPENKPSDLKSVEEVAKDVIAGKYGNGADRVNKLKEAGYNYNEVQAKVNEILGATPSKPTTPTTTHRVVLGENLTLIATKYKTSVSKLIELNKAKYPQIATSKGNYIQAGWVLTVK